MPNKYPQKKGWNVPKQKYKLTNWSEYNEALRRRGDITVWLSEEVLSRWIEPERIYAWYRHAKAIYPINFKMLCFQQLKIVINSGVQGVSNCWQSIIKKTSNSLFKIFCSFEKFIVSCVFIHDFP